MEKGNYYFDYKHGLVEECRYDEAGNLLNKMTGTFDINRKHGYFTFSNMITNENKIIIF